MAQEGMILVELSDGNSAKHGIYGPATKQYYGYRKQGDRFYVWSQDAGLLAHAKTVAIINDAIQPEAAAVSATALVSEDLTTLWGVDESRADKLRAAGLATFSAIGAASVQKLTDILEVSEMIAKRIRAEAAKVVHGVG